jgi:hydrogenase expression/formation protein HypE
MQQIRAGDAILVSGPIGDHGIAVMFAREQFGLRGDLLSDSASVYPLTHALTSLPGLRFMRDPTRGGLTMIMHEIAHATGLGVRLKEQTIPVRDPVESVCEMLGYDPMTLACEGRVVAIIAQDQADAALTVWQAHPQGREAAIIGMVSQTEPRVVLETRLGGTRILDELEDDPLPRIC